jgi:hypothetical protein
MNRAAGQGIDQNALASRGPGNAVPIEPTTSATVLTRLERAVAYAEAHRDALRKIANVLGGELPPQPAPGAAPNFAYPSPDVAGLVGEQHLEQNKLSTVMREIEDEIGRIDRLVGATR